MYDSWIAGLASNYMTTDQILEEAMQEDVFEALHCLNDDDVVKRTANTGFVERWTMHTMTEGEDGEEQDQKSLKGIGKMVLGQPGKFKATFRGKDDDGNDMLDTDQMIDGDPDYLKNTMMRSDVWDNHCTGLDLQTRGRNKGSSVGSILNGFRAGDDETGDALVDIQKKLSEILSLLRDYNAQELPGYVRDNGLQIDDRNGAIMIPGESVGAPFDCTVYPEQVACESMQD